MDTMSQVQGPTDVALLESTIYGQFARRAAARPDSVCLKTWELPSSLSFCDVLLRADQVANGFAALGLQKRDRVGIWMQNCCEWLEVQLATAKLGLILVNVNPDYKAPELEYALNLVRCSALAMVPRTEHSDFIAMMRSLCPEIASSTSRALSCSRVPSLRHVFVTGAGPHAGMRPYSSLYQAGSVEELAGSCDEAVNIQFTSGTTGRPKASTLTHRGTLNNAHFTGMCMGYTVDDVVCVPVPLYHCFGCVLGNLAMVASGCSLVYPAARFNAERTLDAVVEHKCTSLYGVPTMFIGVLDHPKFKPGMTPTLRTGIMAGAPCPVDTMQRVIEEMGARDVSIGYGMTETSPLSWQTSLATPMELRCTTVGEVQPHVECKVVDPETLAVVPRGTPGELWTAGYGVMEGYWNDEQATSNSIVTIDCKRWMRTGDQAVIDAAGYCQIVGRIKDMICRGGENIFPKEIEEVLIAHQRVSLASVIGVPDQRLGEEVCAWVCARGGNPVGLSERRELELDIREYLRDRIMHCKVPRYFRFVDEFPLTVTGKIRKVEMREISSAELGLIAENPPPSKL